MLQAPVPITGVLPARVVVVSPHIAAPVWSGPASATVGLSGKSIVTSSETGAQGALTTVHLNTYVVPAAPLKADDAFPVFPIIPPAPLTILQVPVPKDGTAAARVVPVTPHIGA